MAYHLATFLAIIVLNYIAARYASHRVRQVTFCITAMSPMIFWIALHCWLFLRDGVRTFSDPYFFLLLMMVLGFTLATTATAFLSNELGRRMAG